MTIWGENKYFGKCYGTKYQVKGKKCASPYINKNQADIFPTVRVFTEIYRTVINNKFILIVNPLLSWSTHLTGSPVFAKTPNHQSLLTHFITEDCRKIFSLEFFA